MFSPPVRSSHSKHRGRRENLFLFFAETAKNKKIQPFGDVFLDILILLSELTAIYMQSAIYWFSVSPATYAVFNPPLPSGKLDNQGCL